MTDEDINKLASKLTQSLATKDDLRDLATKKELRNLATRGDINRLEKKIDELDKKADSILEFADGVDDDLQDHKKRLKRLEAIAA